MEQIWLRRSVLRGWVPCLVALFFSSQVNAHAIIDSQCPTTLLYESEAVISKLDQRALDLSLNEIKISVTKIIDGTTDVYHLELNLGDNQALPVRIRFLGPYFEVRSIRLSADSMFPQLFVIDKPAARGYRYTIVPLDSKVLGIKGRAKDYAPSFLSTMMLPIHSEYGMPDSIYPLLTRVSEGTACDLVMFEERFDEYFRYPEFWVSPRVFLFNSETGVVEENQAKTALYRLTEWADAQHQLQRLINAVSNAIHADNVFAESYLSVPKYLWLAKEADQFGEAIEKVNQLISIYDELNGRSEHDRPPLMFATTGVDELRVFKKVSGDIGLFSDHEFEIIEQVYRNFAGNEAGKGG